MLSAAIATSGIALPTQAAVGDATILNKVKAVKVDTGSIKSTVSGIKTRVEEVSSSVNANIAESIDIREILEPLTILKDMKAKLSGGGIDPSELLDSLDTDEIRRLLDDAKAKKQEINDAMNDPTIENFRSDLISMLDGIDVITLEAAPEKPSPLKSLIEKAPIKLLATMKLASGERLQEIIELVSEVSSFYEDHEEEFDTAASGAAFTVSAYQFAREKICNTSRDAQIVKLFKMEKMQRKTIPRLIKGVQGLNAVMKFALDRDFKIGVHGYVATTINPYPPIGFTFKKIARQLEKKAIKLGPQIYKREIILLAQECS
jgi:hypothetical protein